MQGSTDNNIWVLFANGMGSRVSLSLHPGKGEQSRPADAYVVTGGGLSRSARRAAEAVYNWLQENGKNPDRFVAGFDVQHADSSMTGQSSGLAFAVALASQLLNKKGLAVAATGEILEGQFPSLIGKVGGINEKAAAAADLLPSGGVLLYPVENDSEISGPVRAECLKRGLALHPVQSVAEALDLLFVTSIQKEDKGQEAEATATNRFRLVAVGIVGVMLVVFFGWWVAVSFQGEPEKAAENENVEANVVNITPSSNQLEISTPEQEAEVLEVTSPPQPEPVQEQSRYDQGFD